MTDKLMWTLLCVYVAVALSSALEKRWPLCLYWIGATLLTIGVMWMDARAVTETLK
jgi:hypothetical protein